MPLFTTCPPYTNPENGSGQFVSENTGYMSENIIWCGISIISTI